MSELFILQNQDNLFLGKQKDWLDGRDPAALYKTLYKDEAVNQMFEVSSKDYTQRIKVLTCNASDKGLPLIAEDLLPPPLPKVAKKTAEERRNIAALEALEAQQDGSVIKDLLTDEHGTEGVVEGESADADPVDHNLDEANSEITHLSDVNTPVDDLSDDDNVADSFTSGRSDTL